MQHLHWLARCSKLTTYNSGVKFECGGEEEYFDFNSELFSKD